MQKHCQPVFPTMRSSTYKLLILVEIRLDIGERAFCIAQVFDGACAKFESDSCLQRVKQRQLREP